jgi:hypothetical protein
MESPEFKFHHLFPAIGLCLSIWIIEAGSTKTQHPINSTQNNRFELTSTLN